jgi:hypothetical protein
VRPATSATSRPFGRPLYIASRSLYLASHSAACGRAEPVLAGFVLVHAPHYGSRWSTGAQYCRLWEVVTTELTADWGVPGVRER